MSQQMHIAKSYGDAAAKFNPNRVEIGQVLRLRAWRRIIRLGWLARTAANSTASSLSAAAMPSASMVARVSTRSTPRAQRHPSGYQTQQARTRCAAPMSRKDDSSQRLFIGRVHVGGTFHRSYLFKLQPGAKSGPRRTVVTVESGHPHGDCGHLVIAA